MGILAKIERYAAVRGGDFASKFKDVDIEPLPETVTRLIAEITQPEPEMDRLVELISSDTEIASKVLKTINSSLFGLRKSVTDVRHAVALLGLGHIRLIALAYATMDGLPKPESDLFDHEAFCADSLLRAMLSRSFSKKSFSGQMEEAFTASLLADVALPVLLCAWGESYEPVIEEWKQSPNRLSELEQEHFGWDHAQAGAWIAHSWGFPEEMASYVGVHNLSWEKIREFELEDSIVAPIAVASFSSSVLKSDSQRSERVFDGAIELLSMTPSGFVNCLTGVKRSFREIFELFGLRERKAGNILDGLEAAANPENQGEET